MENTGTVCTQVADCSLPRSNNHGRGQPQEIVLLGRMGEWEKGVAIKDNVIIVEKVGIWPMCALLNIKLQQKRTKRKRENWIVIFFKSIFPVCIVTKIGSLYFLFQCVFRYVNKLNTSTP